MFVVFFLVNYIIYYFLVSALCSPTVNCWRRLHVESGCHDIGKFFLLFSLHKCEGFHGFDLSSVVTLFKCIISLLVDLINRYY